MSVADMAIVLLEAINRDGRHNRAINTAIIVIVALIFVGGLTALIWSIVTGRFDPTMTMTSSSSSSNNTTNLTLQQLIQQQAEINEKIRRITSTSGVVVM